MDTIRQQVSRFLLCRKASEIMARRPSFRTATQKYPRSYYCIRCEQVMQTNLQTKPCKHILRSRSNWFTDICNSQCLSHFAALFIVPWAETLNVNSAHFQRSLERFYIPEYEKRGIHAHVHTEVGKSSNKRHFDTVPPISATTSKGCYVPISCE